ncbi:unnamed protein product, partial [Brachionus calyciflorus]
NVVCLYEEALRFLSAFGMYNGNASHDRSVYLEMSGGPDEFTRDITNERLIIDQPRVNISLSGQPSIFIKLVQDELTSKDDGLIHRFLLMGVEQKSFTSENI